MEIGAKWAVNTFNNYVLVEDSDDELQWSKIDMFSSNADLREEIRAVYSNLVWDPTRTTQIKIGLRVEDAERILSTMEDGILVDQRNLRPFPSLYISQSLNEHNQLSFSYGRRINRPSFQQLAPFIIFNDPGSFTTGNPLLNSSLGNNFNLSYSHKSLHATIQYFRTSDVIFQWQPSLDIETGVLALQSNNLDLDQVLSMNLSFPIQIVENWSLRMNGSVRWQQIEDVSAEFQYDQSYLSWNLNAVSSVSLPKGYSLEVFGAYNSPGLAGIVVWDATNLVDVSIQKKFDNASLALTLANVTKGGIWHGSLNPTDRLGYDWTSFFEFYNERVLRLTFSTSFGNQKIKAARSRETAGKEEKSRL